MADSSTTTTGLNRIRPGIIGGTSNSSRVSLSRSFGSFNRQLADSVSVASMSSERSIRGSGNDKHTGILGSMINKSDNSAIVKTRSRTPIPFSQKQQQQHQQQQISQSMPGWILLPRTEYYDPSSSLGETFPIREQQLREVEQQISRLGGLVVKLQRITVVDDQHLATRVHLGRIHLERARLAAESLGVSSRLLASSVTPSESSSPSSTSSTSSSSFLASLIPAEQAASEFWYERACKRGCARNGSGGASASFSGNFIGQQSSLGTGGWQAWAGLGAVLRETGRVEAAVDCLLFSVELERVAPLRGYYGLRLGQF